MADGIRRLLEKAGASWGRGPAESPADIERAQAALGFTFPEDYREFLLLGGLRHGSQSFRGLWPLKDVVSLNQSMPVFKWFRQIVGIGNEGMTVYGIDYRRPAAPCIVAVAWSMSDWRDVSPEAPTFEAWLAQSLF